MRLRHTNLLLLLVIWVATLAALFALLWRAEGQHLVIAAGPSNGASFALAQSIARAVKDRHPGTEVEVFETQGSAENVALLREGRADLATVQADVESDGSVHAVASLYFDAYQLVVADASQIRSPADLAGHRVAIGLSSSGQNRSFWFLAEHYGLDEEDLFALPMSSEAANFAMMQGQVDAVFRVRPPGDPSIRELVSGFPLRVIPIHQAAALSLKHPTVSKGAIPKGSYRGHPPIPKEELPTAVVGRFLVARSSLDSGVVHNITRLLFEERSRLVSENPLAGFIQTPDGDGKLSLPIHPGAQRYYDREKPNFWQRNTRIVAPTLYVIVIVSSTLFALRSRIQGSRRIRVADYNLELMDIAEQAGGALDAEKLHPLKDRLLLILRKVIEDLGRERVSQDEFEHFSFAWNAVDTLVRDRLKLALIPAVEAESQGSAT